MAVAVLIANAHNAGQDLCTAGSVTERQSQSVPQGYYSPDQIDKTVAAIIIDEFCKRFYGTCFRDRLYIMNSIVVTSVGDDPQTGYTVVKGVHSYQGQNVPVFGRKAHTDVPFVAYLAFGLQGVAITFNKWYEPDYAGGKGHWETCSNFLPY